jgi:hypothetical protein
MARVVHAARIYQLELAGGVPAVEREAFRKLDAALVDLYRERRSWWLESAESASARGSDKSHGSVCGSTI